MSYTALYRKFRPDTFTDVKGQDHIVTTLKNQIMADRIGHAYLFCGTRGTGKTTIAKILAKAVNCEHPVDGNPCNECPTCKAIAAGTSMNVIEIDAASNNGVDNIREIRDEVAYSPTSGRFKVYIIDEVHMLSIGAFNALLKTLEEPPSYVIFILATTEVHKIPVTILSRCQRYDFRRIPMETIQERLEELVEAEHVEAEEKALRYIAKKADGGMRDALSLLDQCISFYLGQKLTYDNVLEVLGTVDNDEFSRLLREILAGNVAGAVKRLDELVMQGRDLGQFTTDFTWYLRNLMLLKASDECEDTLDVSTESLALLREEAGMVREDTLMRYIRIFSELSGQMRNAASKRVLLEVAVIKLCMPETETDEISVLERVRRLEAALMNGGWGQSGQGGPAPGYGGSASGYGGGPGTGYSGSAPGYGGGSVPGYDGAALSSGSGSASGYNGSAADYGYNGDSVGGAPGAGYGSTPGLESGPGGFDPAQGGCGGPGAGPGGPAGPFPMEAAAPEDLQRVMQNWRGIVNATHGRFRAALASAVPKFNADGEDGRLFVVFADFLAEPYLQNTEKKEELEQIIAGKIGKKVEVKFLLQADEHLSKEKLSRINVDNALKSIHAEIAIED